MKTILVIGAGKSATHLVEYLLDHAREDGYQIILADANIDLASRKIGQHSEGRAIALNIRNESDRQEWISKADLVISMLPPVLHGLVAEDCVRFSKHLFTASYVDQGLRHLEKELADKDILFLCEMGLDPGIDHMSAMEMMDEVHAKDGCINLFRSHCGGLVAPESDNNPWHYKISWNPRNIIMAGKAGAHYRENGKEKRVEYDDLFTDSRRVSIPQLGELCWYPNRDSLGYEPLYGLKEIPGFVRTTLRHPAFMRGWQQILQLKLTEEAPVYAANGKSMAALFEQHLEQYKLKPVLDSLLNADANGSLATERLAQLDCLGFFDKEWIMDRESCSPADLLQIAVENRLALEEKDRDMIVMLHELEYAMGQRNYRWQASLVVKGEDSLHTAMSKTVGLPLGIASRLLLKGIIRERGIRIPVSPEIYRPVLRELEQHGIAFVHEQTEIIPIAE